MDFDFEAVTGEQILAVPMVPERNDAGADSVRDYLVNLLRVLWAQQSGFSGKRPFGNSSWEYDLYEALAKGGYPVATFDQYGDIDSISPWADRLIARAIRALSA